ncbi:MAG: glycosyltransferase family 39 protein [Anaerolineae bacterium]|nr:glycosyltransferase family 39 protein [Anaerolineae bacterium]
MKWFPIRILLLFLLLLAAALRFRGLDWDGGIGAHPDERYIVGVAEALRWPDRLNPFEVSTDFAYGHLPLYLLALSRALDASADPLFVGRGLAALFDLGTVALTFALGRQVWGRRAGLLAAAFVALMVLHVQQAHFYTADVPQAFFSVGALLFAVRLAARGQMQDARLAGAWAGLAVGAKFGSALLAIPLGAACFAAPVRRGLRWRCALQVGVVGGVAFALANPFALLSFPIFWRNVARESAIARGLLDVPYTRQFHAAWPYVYPVLQQLRWGMGWPLGVVVFGGWAFFVWRAARRLLPSPGWAVLAWTVPFVAFVGALYAKFPRYWLPVTPALAVCAAGTIVSLHGRIRNVVSGLAYLALVCSLLFCLAFVNLYDAPHPWLAASEWIGDYVPRGSTLAVEHWDHPLPVGLIGGYDYDVRELPLFDEDSEAKWVEIEAALAEADYVILASRRGYATLARWSERYPLAARYYRRLFEGELGFEPVACFGRYPHLGPVVLRDDPAAGLGFALPGVCQTRAAVLLRSGRLDESFVVYDHPQVVIFRRRFD